MFTSEGAALFHKKQKAQCRNVLGFLFWAMIFMRGDGGKR
jgi:hypothetical protein